MQAFFTLIWLGVGALLAWTLLIPPPSFGFATALAFALWLALAVYALEKRFYPALRIPWLWPVSLLLSGVLLVLLPRHTLGPTTSVLFVLHTLFALTCYALFILAVIHGWLLTQREKQLRHPTRQEVPGLPLLTLERLMFNFVALGFVLLSITLVLGIGFYEVLYGADHVWHWEHKTVFAILSWLVFAVLLWGRYRLGWRGRKAVRWVYTGAVLLLLSYVGSRFVLEILLGR